MKCVILVAAFNGLVVCAFAQTNFQARDYGAGFDKFYRLGLPDVRGATYGVLDVLEMGRMCDSDKYTDLSMLSLPGSRGNAWRIKDLGGGTNRYLYRGVMFLDVIDIETYKGWRKRRLEERAKTPGGQQERNYLVLEANSMVGKWKPVDLAKDVTGLLNTLEHPDDRTREQISSEQGLSGCLLLLTAQFHRLGMTNEANRIAGKLFESREDPRGLVQESVNILADAQYHDGLVEFRRDHDWAAWHRSLTNLLARFPTSWAQEPGVRRLTELVKARANQPVPPALEGEGLTDEDQRLARSLVTDPPEKEKPYGDPEDEVTCWIFPRLWTLASEGSPPATDIVPSIQVRGMKAIPMLVAMLRDSTLMHPDRTWERTMRRANAHERTVENSFNSLDRPKTRAELARRLLEPLVVVEDWQNVNVYRMDMDDFAAEGEAWYKKSKGKSLVDLAKMYAEKGYPGQQKCALTYLMCLQHKDFDATRADIERLLLALTRESTDAPDVVREYVWRRGNKASNFVEQVARVILGANAGMGTRQPASRSGNNRRPDKEDEGREFVAYLRECVAVKEIEERATEFLSSTQSVEEAGWRFGRGLDVEDPHKSLSVILGTAVKTDDPRKRVVLLSSIAALRHAREGGWTLTEEGTLNPVTGEMNLNRFAPTNHTAEWKSFLEDQRGEGVQVNVAAARAIETLYDDGRGQTGSSLLYWSDLNETGKRLSDVVEFFGERGTTILLDRAKARIAGKTVPVLPDARRVDAGQRERLFHTMTSAVDVASVLAELTLDQRLALKEMCMSNRVLNAKLRPLADTVTRVKISEEFKSTTGLEAKLKGRRFDRETVRTLLEVSQELAKKGTAFSLSMNRILNLGGMEITLSCPPCYRNAFGTAPVKTTAIGTNRQYIAEVTGEAHGGSHSTSARWSVREHGETMARLSEGHHPDLRENKSGAEKMMDEMESDMHAAVEMQKRNAQDRFWEELDLIIEKVGAYAPFWVRFSGFGRSVAAERK